MDCPLVAQLAHVEVLTPAAERTLWFFHDLIGMEETSRRGRSVYLRAYEDLYHHTLVVTESRGPGSATWPGARPPRRPWKRAPGALRPVASGGGGSTGTSGTGLRTGSSHPRGTRWSWYGRWSTTRPRLRCGPPCGIGPRDALSAASLSAASTT